METPAARRKWLSARANGALAAGQFAARGIQAVSMPDNHSGMNSPDPWIAVRRNCPLLVLVKP